MIPKRLEWRQVSLRLAQFPHLPFRVLMFRGKRMLGKGSAIVATTPVMAMGVIDAHMLMLREVA